MPKQIGEEPYELDKHIGFNLILDGIGDFINGLFGSTAGTNYGENNSLMAITLQLLRAGADHGWRHLHAAGFHRQTGSPGCHCACWQSAAAWRSTCSA